MKKFFKKYWPTILPTLLVFSLVFGSLFYFMAWIFPHPLINESYIIKFTDTENNLLFQTHFNDEGLYVPLDKISFYLKDFYIAIEDKDFYRHNGLDLARMVKAFLVNTSSKEIKQGASTITQQLARILYLNNDKTYSRKLKEMFYAARIETYFSKEEILEAYLNSLYFGHDIYGVEDAANFYFAKSAYELTIAEAALLVGISNAPGIYSPFINLEKAHQKKEQILKILLNKKRITKEEYQAAIKENIFLYGERKSYVDKYVSYYKDAILKELYSLNLYSKKELANGLTIATNIDLDVSKQIQEILDKYQPKEENTQVSVLVMKPYSNKIIALFGGWDYQKSNYNRAILSKRQPASTIKPLLYYLALVNGMQPDTLLMSEKTSFFIKNFGVYEPTNNNDIYPNQKISMIEAISTSDNIYAVKTGLIIGSTILANLIKRFGIKDFDIVPSLALGSLSATPLEMISIYNTFASEGVYHKPSLVNKVYDSKGYLLYEEEPISYQMLSLNETLILNQMLTATFDENAKGKTNPTMLNYQTDKIFAAKTGTTESDSWVIGFNPNYTICVWVGTDDNQKLNDFTLSKKIFKDIANTIDKKSEAVWYSTNEHLVVKKVDPLTGRASSNGSYYFFNR